MQIAIALAVLVNAIFIVQQRMRQIDRPTDIDERNLFTMDIVGFTDAINYDAVGARGPGLPAQAPGSRQRLGEQLYAAAIQRQRNHCLDAACTPKAIAPRSTTAPDGRAGTEDPRRAPDRRARFPSR